MTRIRRRSEAMATKLGPSFHTEPPTSYTFANDTGNLQLYTIYIRNRQRFFEQVGHETMFVSSGNKHFFTKSCRYQTYQNYEQPPQTYQNSDFQSHFSVSKISQIFPKKCFLKNIRLGDQLLFKKMFLKILIFKMLYLLKMFPIFVGSLHNFGRSDGDMIL